VLMVKLWKKKAKTSPIPRLKEERAALDKLVPWSLLILSWGVGKPWENARKAMGKSEENGDFMTFKGVYGLMIAKLTCKLVTYGLWGIWYDYYYIVGYIGI